MGRLSYYRKSIDLIDKKIVKLLLIRFGLAKQIGNYKRKNKRKITDRGRQQEVLNNVRKNSGKHKKFMINIFKNITKYSKKIQM